MSSPRLWALVTLVPEYTTYSGRLGGWPLPTMADGDALHVTRTKAFSAVGVRKYWKKDCDNLFSSISKQYQISKKGSCFLFSAAKCP
ncbi:MAG: hypothetical protein HHJ16_09705 [Polaromonas sp.]|uniref:hypothetical protein n=1 Tax=Polaromonas sp. TaxID=1869339 RepID=UPI0017C32A88|nr:hypothetical protein [Polaromonas sp.]NMM10535.1 hypothetical protein [Polaromonas sp.]